MGAVERRAATEALMSTSRTMTAIVARTLSSLHDTVTVAQLRVMVIISTRGSVNLTSVADALGVNPSTASRTCDKLVAAGLLTRSDREDDRRNIELSLTAEGRSVVSSLMEDRRALLDEAVSRMSEADQRQLASSLTAFSAAMSTLGSPRGALTDDTSARWVDLLM